jgi:hypothetical protein
MNRAQNARLAGIGMLAAAAWLSTNAGCGSGDSNDFQVDASEDGASPFGRGDARSPDGASKSDGGAEGATGQDAVSPSDTGSKSESGADAGSKVEGGADAALKPDAGSTKDAAVAPDSSGADAGRDGAPAADGGSPTGWLYTSGSKIYVSNGAGGGTQWMGRGVNVDDIFLCGYNYTLYLSSPDQTLEAIVAGAIGWKANFLRISLAMASDGVTASWLSNASQYKTPMTNVIQSVGQSAGVYVLVTLRSDTTMTGQDQVDGDPEATGIPSAATDAVFQALVDTFANDSFVLFGLSNEPGGNKASNAALSAAMSHSIGTIRAEEDKLGVPHHVVSVQGNSWTSDISFYAASPLPYDNVVYEVHGYPPAASSYTYANIPVIIGEYGSLTDSAGFYADVESKQIPNLAWDFEPYSDCSPDLLTVTNSTSSLMPTSWGSTVQSYLASH